VAALAPAGSRLERGKICRHLVYTDDRQEYSLFLRQEDSAPPLGIPRKTANGKPLHAADFGTEQVATFRSDRLTALFVAGRSAESALSLARAAAARL
jgi:hypothetical protein